MDNYICATCGAQFAETAGPPARCPICEDERQWVPPTGQRWTTLTKLRQTHQNIITPVDPGLTTIRTTPRFAIGQQAQVIQTRHGNLLWDAISLIDDATIEATRALGGIDAIAISHPHFYASVAEWSRTFGDAPIHMHAVDADWAQRPTPAITRWSGDTLTIWPGLTLIRCGGHFPGALALHWADGAEGRGALFTGDTISVCPGNRWVSFMYSFPMDLPLSAAAVRRVVAAVEPFAFDRIYGSWHGEVIATDAKAVVRRSAERYLRCLDAA